MLPVLVVAALLGQTSAPALPAWSELEKEHELSCELPFDLRARPLTRTIGTQVFVLEGSLVRRTSPAGEGVVVGVLSAIKEVEDDTLDNLRTAVGMFKERQVDVVVVNGDVALDQFDLAAVMKLLGASGLPVFVGIGNSEGRGGFNRAFVEAEKEYPNLFNLNWQRRVELGRVVLLSLPGYHDRVFMPQRSGCQYKQDALDAIAAQARVIKAEGRTPVLVAHGPPRSTGKVGIDLAHEAGHVGDPAMTALIEGAGIPYGLFGHILEAGGQASSDLGKGTPAKPGVLLPALHVNAGSASATPWTLLDGRSSRGMAMVVRFEATGARYELLTLRR